VIQTCTERRFQRAAADQLQTDRDACLRVSCEAAMDSFRSFSDTFSEPTCMLSSQYTS